MVREAKIPAPKSTHVIVDNPPQMSLSELLHKVTHSEGIC